MRRYSGAIIIALGLAGCVLVPIVAQTPAAPGQGDVFSSNSRQATDSCNAAYERQMAQASAHEGQVNAQWQRDVAACRGDQTCAEAARQKRERALGQVQTERVDAETAHGICEARRQLQGRASLDTDPCNAAYERQMELAYEHEAGVNDRWQKDVIACQGDQTCAEAARQKRQNALGQVQQERSDAAAARGACGTGRRLQGNANAGRANGNSSVATDRPRQPAAGPQPSPGAPNSGTSNPAPPMRGFQPAPGNPGACQGASAQETADFKRQLLADAQALLLGAGRISKAMTDSMDVTKHNDVGVQVGISACLAAFPGVATFLRGWAQRVTQAAAVQCAGAQEAATLQIANVSASEAEEMANQAVQEASQAPSGGAAMGAAGSAAGYMEDAIELTQSADVAVAQGNLPTCTVLACDRLAQLLGRNIDLMQVFDRIRPHVQLVISKTGEVTLKGGLRPAEVADGLRRVGINAQVGVGMTNMMNEVRAGKPVIVGVYIAACPRAPLHALVVEGVETMGGVTGLRIYDPVGRVYWQPVRTFQRYFTKEFVRAR